MPKEMADTRIQMQDMFMKERFKKVCRMGRVRSLIKTGILMREILCTDKSSGKELIALLMGKFISVAFTIIKVTAKESLYTQMPLITREIGSLVNSMALVSLCGRMVRFMKESM